MKKWTFLPIMILFPNKGVQFTLAERETGPVPERRVNNHDEVLVGLIREIQRLIDIAKPKGKRHPIGFISRDTTKENS